MSLQPAFDQNGVCSLLMSLGGSRQNYLEAALKRVARTSAKPEYTGVKNTTVVHAIAVVSGILHTKPFEDIIHTQTKTNNIEHQHLMCVA